MFIYKNICYMYDARKNKLLQLSAEAYEEINRFLDNKNYSSEIITSLQRKGYLLGSNITALEHPFSPFLNNILDRHASTLILQVTQKCNFRCRYCTFANDSKATRTHSNKTMSFETAKESIDFFASHSCDTPEITIAFYGGEPLLNFNLIKKCVDYAEETIYNKSIVFSMTTNLFLATEEMVEFLVKHQFRLLISLDGPEPIQNNHRRLSYDGSGTYKTVFENVKKLKEKNRDYFYSFVQFNPVVYLDEEPQKIIDFYRNELDVPISNVQLQRIDDTGLNIAYDPFNEIELQQNNIIFDSKMNFYYKSVLNSKEDITPCYHINGSCVPGANKLFVSVNGEFFPCEKVNECNKNMMIGSIKDGFDVNKIKFLMNIGEFNIDNCKNCWAIRFCNVCCAHCDDGESNLSKTMLKSKCNNTQLTVLNYIKEYIDSLSI